MWTDRSIKALKPREQRYRKSDKANIQRGVGRLAFEVQPSGAKTAYFQYFVDGKRKYERIGLYKTSAKSTGLSLADIQTEMVRLSDIHQKHQDVGDYLAMEKVKVALEADLLKSAQQTLAEVLDAYISEKDLKAGTIKDYRKAIKETFSEYLDKPITDIGREVIRALYRKRSRKSVARANNAMRVFRAIYNYHRAATRQDDGAYLIAENPVDALNEMGITKKIRRRKTYIEPDQVKPWFNAVLGLDDSRFPSGAVVRDYMLFTLLTGVRREEAMTLTVNQFDIGRGRFKLFDTKNREDVEIPMSDYVIDLLRHRISDNQGSKFVFPGKDSDKPIGSFKRPLKYLKDESGVDFSIHDLRRTFITVAESLDISVYTFKRLVNHKIDESKDVTAGYIGIDIERMRRATQKVTDEILKQAGVRKKPAKVIRLAK